MHPTSPVRNDRIEFADSVNSSVHHRRTDAPAEDGVPLDLTLSRSFSRGVHPVNEPVFPGRARSISQSTVTRRKKNASFLTSFASFGKRGKGRSRRRARSTGAASAMSNGNNNEAVTSGTAVPTITHLEKKEFDDDVFSVDSSNAGDQEEQRIDTKYALNRRQEFHGRYLLWLAYQSTGVIYGDIGTSPLYVFSSTFDSAPSRADLLGALSLIIWTLTLMVTLKYVIIVLRADDHGEGGTFAVYSLLSRYANIVRWDPREERKVFRGTPQGPASGTKTFLERSRWAQMLLKVVGVFGVSLVMADGILTPAQSVLGAIQGLTVVDSTIGTPTIIGVSCTILILLFLIQPLGVTKIGSAFAPIVIVWLLFNFCFGIYNLVRHDHSVLVAFSPYYAGDFFVRNKTEGWRMLGGILLCFTGVEALFADLGAFSRRAIQLSWLCFAYPALLLAYIGQCAYISRNPEAYDNPFFQSVPPGAFYPSLIIAILAAVVASQTMITATFQLLSQIVKLSYFPQIKVVHTSKIFHNQIYIPWVNWLLMVGTVAVTAAYNNTTKLGEAYGVCVILVTFLTTCMVSLAAIVVWGIKWYLVLPIWLVFTLMDGLYLSSALTKVPDGAWLTLCIAIVLSSIFLLWRFGKENQWRAEASDKIAPGDLIVWKKKASSGVLNAEGDFDTNEDDDDDSSNFVLQLGPAFEASRAAAAARSHRINSYVPRTYTARTLDLDDEADTITRLRGIGIFFDKTGYHDGAPAVFVHFLQKFRAAPAVTVFFTIKTLACPTVAPEDRFSVARCYVKNHSAAASKVGSKNASARASRENLSAFTASAAGGNATGAMHLGAGLNVPPNQHQLHAHHTPIPDFYRVVLRHGYADRVITSELDLLIYENIRDYIIREGIIPAPAASVTGQEATTVPAEGGAGSTQARSDEKDVIRPAASTAEGVPKPKYPSQETIRRRLLYLQAAYQEQVVNVVGKEQMRISSSSSSSTSSTATAIGEASAPESVGDTIKSSNAVASIPLPTQQGGRGWTKTVRAMPRNLALAAFLWLRNNTGNRIANMGLAVERVVEIGFVKEV